MPDEGRALIDRYVEALRDEDPHKVDRLIADTFVEEWPQSGERILGLANRHSIAAADPQPRPILTRLRRTLGHGDLWVVEFAAERSNGQPPAFVVQSIGLHGGKVGHVTTYVGHAFPAPAWREQWVERFEPFAPPTEIPHEHAMTTEEGETLAKRYVTLDSERAYDKLQPMRHPRWTAEWPQSGERVPSHAADEAIHRNYPGFPDVAMGKAAAESERWAVSPMLIPIRVAGAGNIWVATGLNTYSGGDRFVVTNIIEFSGRLIRRETMYFVEPSEAPAWRAPWVERYDPFPGQAGS